MAERRVEAGQAQKQCRVCKHWHPETADHFYRGKRNSLRNICKTCHVADVMGRRPAPKPLASAAAQWLDNLTRQWAT
jgi:hypothetical protein